jgi:hypothetical protein
LASEWISILRSPRLAISGLFLAGALAAAPTYYHIFQINQSAAGFSPVSYALLKTAATSANYLFLAPLAALGAWRARGPFVGEIRTMATAGFLLLGALVVFHLEQGNEHNLANAAQCLLALPAASCIFSVLRRPIGAAPRATVPFLISIAAFLPMSIATLWSFQDRPGIPLEFQDNLLRRVPRDGPLEGFYSWAREQTPRDAVFVSDPSRPVKMSGNVAELPAFAFRSLFIDRESYLTTPNPDAPARTRIAEQLARGTQLDDAEANYLRELNRPLYLVTYRADQSLRLKSLIAQHGEPAFAKGFVAVFGLQVGDLTGSEE